MNWSIFKESKFFVIKCEQRSIIDQLKSGGAVQHPLLSESVRFAISDDASPLEVGEAEELYAVPVVTPEWVELSASVGQFLPFKPFHPEFRRLFKGLTFAFSELSFNDRFSLCAYSTIHGAKIQHHLDKEITHVVLGRACGNFYKVCQEALKDSGVKLVSPDWIVDCLSATELLPCESYHPDLLKRPYSPPKPLTSVPQDTVNAASADATLANSNDAQQSAPRQSENDAISQFSLVKSGQSQFDYSQTPRSTGRSDPSRTVAAGVDLGRFDAKRSFQQDQRVSHHHHHHQQHQQQLQHQRFLPSVTMPQVRFTAGTSVSQRFPVGHQQRHPINAPGMHDSKAGSVNLLPNTFAGTESLLVHPQSAMMGSHHQGLMLSTSGATLLPATSNTPSGVSGHHGKSKSKHSSKHSQEQNLNEEEKDAIVFQYVKNILSSQNKTQKDTSGKTGSSSGSEPTSSGLSSAGTTFTGVSSGAIGLHGQIAGLGMGNTMSVPSSGTPRKPKSPKSPARAAIGTGAGAMGTTRSPKSPKGSKVNALSKVLTGPSPPSQQLLQQQQPSASLMMGAAPGSAMPSVLFTGGLPQMPARPISNIIQPTGPPGTPRPLQHFITANNLPVQHQQHVLSAAPTYIVQRQPNGQIVASVSKPSPQGPIQPQTLGTPTQFQRSGGLLAAVSNPISGQMQGGVARQLAQQSNLFVQRPTAQVSRGPAVPNSVSPGSVLLRSVGPSACGILTGTQQAFSHIPAGSLLYSPATAMPPQQAAIHAQPLANQLPQQHLAKGNQLSLQQPIFRTNMPVGSSQIYPPPGSWPGNVSPGNLSAAIRAPATPIRPPSSPARPVPPITSLPVFPPTYYGHEGSPKPSRPEECLIGCVFLLLGYRSAGEQQRTLWRRIIRSYGAEVVASYDSTRVTHLIIDCQLEEPDIVKQALRDRVRVVTIFWVNDVLSKGRMVPPYEILHLPSPFSNEITFSFIKSQIISLTGFEGKERLKVEFMIRQLGASFTDYLEPSNTLLVCKNPDGKKYEMAQLWSIPCVNVRWLQDLYFGDLRALAVDIPHKYLSFETADVVTSLDRCTPRVQDLMVGWLTPIRLNHETWARLNKLSAEFASEERERKRKLEQDLLSQPASKRAKNVLSPLDEDDIKLALCACTRLDALTKEMREKSRLQAALQQHLSSVSLTDDHCTAYSQEIKELVFHGTAITNIPAEQPAGVKLEEPATTAASAVSIADILTKEPVMESQNDKQQGCDSKTELTSSVLVHESTLQPSMEPVTEPHDSKPESTTSVSMPVSTESTLQPSNSPPNVVASAMKSEPNDVFTDPIQVETTISSSQSHCDNQTTSASSPLRKRVASPMLSQLDSKRPALGSESTHLHPEPPRTEDCTTTASPSTIPSPSTETTQCETKPLQPVLLDSTVRISFTAIDYETRLALMDLCLQMPDCEIVDSAENATHLVCSRLLRTPKTYIAVALGRYLVTPKWIQASVLRGTWLDEQPWILKDPEAEKQLGVDLRESITRARRRQFLGPRAALFAGVEFWLSPGACHREMCATLLRLCGGIIRTKRPTQKMALLPQPRQLVICHEDDSHVATYLMRVKTGNKAVHHEEFVLSGVLHQEMDFESYQIQYVNSLQTSLRAAIAAAESTISCAAPATQPHLPGRVIQQEHKLPASTPIVDRSTSATVKAVTSLETGELLTSQPPSSFALLVSLPGQHTDRLAPKIPKTTSTSGLEHLLAQPNYEVPPHIRSPVKNYSVPSVSMETSIMCSSNLQIPTLVSTQPTFFNLTPSIGAVNSQPIHENQYLTSCTSSNEHYLNASRGHVETPSTVNRSRPTSLLLTGTQSCGGVTHLPVARPVTALTAMIVAAESASNELHPSIGLVSNELPGSMHPLLVPKGVYRSQPTSATSSGTLNARVAAADAHAVATATALIHNERSAAVTSKDALPFVAKSTARPLQPVNLYPSESDDSKMRSAATASYAVVSSFVDKSVGNLPLNATAHVMPPLAPTPVLVSQQPYSSVPNPQITASFSGIPLSHALPSSSSDFTTSVISTAFPLSSVTCSEVSLPCAPDLNSTIPAKSLDSSVSEAAIVAVVSSCISSAPSTSQIGLDTDSAALVPSMTTSAIPSSPL